MTSKAQDKQFRDLMQENIIDEDTMQPEVLTAAIEWISKHLNPEQVFSDKELDNWAKCRTSDARILNTIKIKILDYDNSGNYRHSVRFPDDSICTINATREGFDLICKPWHEAGYKTEWENDYSEI